MSRRLGVVLGGVVLWMGASLLSRPSQSAGAERPLLAGAQVDPQVLAIFERACQDCHSYRTHYLWYSYIAPISWWTENHVSSGRRHLNFSTWESYPLTRKERLLTGIANQVKEREMPLSSYLLIHQEARLSDADIDTVFQWTQKERARLFGETDGK